MLSNWLARYDKFGGWLGVVANSIMVGAMLLTVVNVLLRIVFRTPFGGASEVVGWCTGVLTALALVYSQKRRAHIAIDVLSAHFNRRVRAIIQGLCLIAGTIMFGMGAWQIFVRALSMQRSGLLSNTLQISFYPLLWITGIGIVFFAVRLFLEALVDLAEGGRR